MFSEIRTGGSERRVVAERSVSCSMKMHISHRTEVGRLKTPVAEVRSQSGTCKAVGSRTDDGHDPDKVYVPCWGRVESKLHA